MDVIQAPELGRGSISKDSMESWFTAVGDVHTKLTFRNDSTRQFAGMMSTSAIGSLRACSFRSTALTASRTQRDIASGAEGTTIMIWQFRGYSVASQRGHESRLDPGTLSFLDLDTPYQVSCSEGYGQLVIHLPTDALVSRLRDQGVRRDFRGSVLKPEPQTTPWLAFLGTAFSQAQAAGAAAMEGLYAPALDALATLAGMAIGQRAPESNGDILIQSVRTVIANNYWRPDFTAEYLAGQLHVSRRTLFRAMDEAQLSLAEMLQQTRLNAAAGMLRNAACSLTVEAIGLAVGYQSVSTFHSRFRASFGVSPGAYRHQALSTGTHPHMG